MSHDDKEECLSEEWIDFYAGLNPSRIVTTSDPMVTHDYYDLAQLRAAFEAGRATWTKRGCIENMPAEDTALLNKAARSARGDRDLEGALAGIADCINTEIRENGPWDDQIHGWVDTDMRPFIRRLVDYVRHKVQWQHREAMQISDMLMLDGNCSDPSLTGPAKLRRILDDLIEARAALSTERENLDDGFGNVWQKCGPECELEIVRPGKVQCNRCDERAGIIGATSNAEAAKLNAGAAITVPRDLIELAVHGLTHGNDEGLQQRYEWARRDAETGKALQALLSHGAAK